MRNRLPVVVVLLGGLLLGLLFDRARDDDGPAAEVTTVDASVFPVSSPPGAFSSTWFCAGGTADADAFADHAVVIANTTDAPVETTVTVFAGVVAPPAVAVDPEDLDEEPEGEEDGAEEGDQEDVDEDATPVDPADLPEPTTVEVTVGPRTRETLALSEVVQAPIVSAMVEAGVGGVVVEHEVTSIHGHDAKPCATAASPTWHFAWGDTSVDARELLVLFNPFPDDAIVEARFSAEDGIREPARLDGFVVPGRGTVAIDLGDDVTRRNEVAGTIVARSGRVVVDRILRVNGDGDRGLTVQLGVPEPQTTWAFPDGFTSDVVREEFAVYNPGEQVAEVSIEFTVDDPETNGIPAPVDLSLAPGTHQVVDLNADGRVPLGVAHSTVVRSANGVPVVAERTLFSADDSRRGISVSTGSPVEAEQWTFAAGAATETSDEWITLLNLDTEVLAEVDVHALAGGRRFPIEGLQSIELGPGQRLSLRLGEHISRPDLPVVVDASEPIVVERGLYRVGGETRGFSNTVGIPTAGTLRMPADPFAAAPTDLDLGDTGDQTDDTVVPEAPEDVDLPEPDETIVIDDPDAEVDDAPPTTSGSSTTAVDDDVPETTP